jgi:hypothetical protein
VQIPTEAWRAAVQPTSHVAAPGADIEINNKVGIVGILTEAQHGAINEATHQLSDSRDCAIAFANVSGCMEDLGMLVKGRLSPMDSGHRETLLQLSASAILELVDDITPVVAERTEDNEAYIDAAPDKNNAKKFTLCI